MGSLGAAKAESNWHGRHCSSSGFDIMTGCRAWGFGGCPRNSSPDTGCASFTATGRRKERLLLILAAGATKHQACKWMD